VQNKKDGCWYENQTGEANPDQQYSETWNLAVTASQKPLNI
jgi:hypothetical protein